MSRKKYASRFEKKKTRVEKERMLTSCDINRCLHFTETRFRSKVVVSWLPNIAGFFFSLARLIEDLERQLSSASYDSSEFLFRRLDEYKSLERFNKSQLAEIQITKPKHNLSPKDPQALKELQQNTGARHRHQADKGITTVDTNKTDKIREGQIQLDDEHNYKPLVEPMLKETQSKVKRLINYGKHNDEMTR